MSAVSATGGRPARRAARGRSARGFSLIELMVAVAIVAIITAIAVPSYRRYVLEGHRSDAIRSLTYYQQAFERCYSQNFTYNGCAQAPAANTPSTDGYYLINLPTQTATQYTLTATSTGDQTADTQCTTFTVSQNGAQSAVDSGGADTTQTCWGGK